MSFPDICYSDIRFTVEPMVDRTVSTSGASRQRYLRKKRDDQYDVSFEIDSSDLSAFETFITDEINNGADTFSGPYFDGDVERTGTLEIINGDYTVDYITNDWWRLSFSFEVKDRDMSDAENIYNVVNDVGGFESTSLLLDALENMVNFNELNA